MSLVCKLTVYTQQTPNTPCPNILGFSFLSFFLEGVGGRENECAQLPAFFGFGSREAVTFLFLFFVIILRVFLVCLDEREELGACFGGTRYLGCVIYFTIWN